MLRAVADGWWGTELAVHFHGLLHDGFAIEEEGDVVHAGCEITGLPVELVGTSEE